MGALLAYENNINFMHTYPYPGTAVPVVSVLRGRARYMAYRFIVMDTGRGKRYGNLIP